MASEPSLTYTLEKPFWTEADFEKMGWHDARIHAFAFQPELRELWVDLDYIFSWVHPEEEGRSFRLWIAPVTLVFRKIHSLEFHLETTWGYLSLQGLLREIPDPPANPNYQPEGEEWLWRLDANEGEVCLVAPGYTQFTRRAPMLADSQWLTMEQRGGISFAREFSA